MTMTFQMIKFSMIHLAPYETKFYRDMIEILVSAFRSKYSHRIRMIHISTELLLIVPSPVSDCVRGDRRSDRAHDFLRHFSPVAWLEPRGAQAGAGRIRYGFYS